MFRTLKVRILAADFSIRTPAVLRKRHDIVTAFLQSLVQVFCFSLSHSRILSSMIIAKNAANIRHAAISLEQIFMPFMRVLWLLLP